MIELIYSLRRAAADPLGRYTLMIVKGVVKGASGEEGSVDKRARDHWGSPILLRTERR
jgi:hypothetical protein